MPKHMALKSYVATEGFVWKESVPKKQDFLTESGSRLAIGLAYSNSKGLKQGLLFELDGRIYNGTVSYNGNAFSLAESDPELKPFKSNTHYLGNTIELKTGYRFPIYNVQVLSAFDATVALGSNYWERNIGGGTLADGTPVTSYLETYHDIYLKSGIGLVLRTKNYQQLINVGIKYPLQTRETITFSSMNAELNLNPNPAISSYATWQIYPLIPQSTSLTLSLYVENTRYKDSDSQDFSYTLDGQQYHSSLYQPDSNSSVTGMRIYWEY
jgi:hypothetical protein